MGKINIQEVEALRNNLKTNLGFVNREYKNKTSSINSKMSSVISSYAEYSDVTSKAREIQRIIADIKREASSLEKMTSKLTDGLKGVAGSVKSEERESSAIIRTNKAKITPTKIKDKSIISWTTGFKTITGKGNAFSNNAIINDVMMQDEIMTNGIQVMAQNSEDMTLDQLNALYVENESRLIKQLSEEECETNIRRMLQEYYESQEHSDIPIGDINTLEGFRQAIEQYLISKNLDIAYEILSEDPKEQAQILTYWLALEEKGINLKEYPVPNGWLEGKEKNFSVDESNYNKSKDAAYKYYVGSQYIVDLIQGDGLTPNVDMSFEKWYKKQYGQLDPKSHDIQRLKYEIENGLNGINLKNEQGLYDNEETEAFKNARNLFLNAYDVYDKFWHSKAIFTNNNKILQGIIDGLKKSDQYGVVIGRDVEYEQKIVSGEYQQVKDFISRLDDENTTIVDNGNGKITITKQFLMASDIDRQDLLSGKVKIEDMKYSDKYVITLNYSNYQNEKYIISKEFIEEFIAYQEKRFRDGGYSNDFNGLGNYELYAEKAQLACETIKKQYPEADLGFEQVMALIRMTDERMALYEPQKTDSERIQDAMQEVVSGIALVTTFGDATAIAIGAEGVNAATSATRERYSEMYMNLLNICLLGSGKFISLKEVKELGVKYGDNAIKLIEQYGAEAFEVIEKYGDDAYKLVNKYGNDAVSLIIKYEDDAISLLSKYGDDGINIINKYGNNGVALLKEGVAKPQIITSLLSEKTSDVINGINKLCETNPKLANKLSKDFLNSKASEIGIDNEVLKAYIEKLDSEALWDSKSFKEAYYKNRDLYGETWKTLSEKEHEMIALKDTSLGELLLPETKQYTNATQTLEEMEKRYISGNLYYDHQYSLNDILKFKINKESPPKEYLGIKHSECLPKADKFISDERVLQQVKDLLPDNQAIQQCKDLQSLANEIYKQKPTVQLVTFQSASSQGKNVVTTGNFGNIYGKLETTGPFQVPTSALKEYAVKYPDYCSYENNIFKITNMEQFGKEALSGVPLSSNEGAYMIVTDVPISNETLGIPSVCNASSYPAYFVPGGKLLSGGTEATICPLENVIDKGQAIGKSGINGMNSTKGIKYVIYKLEK